MNLVDEAKLCSPGHLTFEALVVDGVVRIGRIWQPTPVFLPGEFHA